MCISLHVSSQAEFARRYTVGHSTVRILREGCLSTSHIRISLHVWALNRPDAAIGARKRIRASLHEWALDRLSCETVSGAPGTLAFRYVLALALDRPDPCKRGAPPHKRIRVLLHAWALDIGRSCERVA